MLEKILKQYGLDKVSAKTRISKKHLSMLRDKDFTGFSKPQAYGFVSILQREYGDDFTELKAELEAWFSTGESEEKKDEIFISADARKPEAKQKGVVFVVLLLILGIAALYFFQKQQEPKNEAQEVSKPQAAVVAPKSETEESKPLASAPQPQTQSTQTAEPEHEKIVEAKEPEAAATAVKEQSEPKPYVPMENAVITPIVKLWFGIIDLENKKRVAKTTADPYEIESKGKKLLITGHGRFEISDSFGNLFKYNDAKKHYFLIDDGMVKEIPVSEFRRLNGGKVW